MAWGKWTWSKSGGWKWSDNKAKTNKPKYTYNKADGEWHKVEARQKKKKEWEDEPFKWCVNADCNRWTTCSMIKHLEKAVCPHCHCDAPFAEEEDEAEEPEEAPEPEKKPVIKISFPKTEPPKNLPMHASIDMSDKANLTDTVEALLNQVPDTQAGIQEARQAIAAARRLQRPKETQEDEEDPASTTLAQARKDHKAAEGECTKYETQAIALESRLEKAKKVVTDLEGQIKTSKLMLKAAVNKRDSAHDARNQAAEKMTKPDESEGDHVLSALRILTAALLPKVNLEEAVNTPLPGTPTHKDAAMNDRDGKDREGQDTEETAEARKLNQMVLDEIESLDAHDPEQIRKSEEQQQALWHQQAQEQQAVMAQQQQ